MEFKLTKNQQKVFNTIEGTKDNVAVLGEPGVGKSVLIRALTESGKKSYTLAAPTGLAALNIGGKTLHSLFRLPVSEGIVALDFNRFNLDDRTLNNLKYNVHALIIDEVSMVRADMFDFIDRLLRMVKEKDLPFGGIQVIIVGDFCQLPPVVQAKEAAQLRAAGYRSAFVFDSKIFTAGNFQTLLLNEVLRQKGDNKFMDILKRARTGDVTIDDTKLLNKSLGMPDDLRIRLCGSNKQADEVNQAFLNKLETEERTYYADKFGEWPALPAEETLRLKVGAQVMVKQNGADKPEGFLGPFVSKVVNGTLGEVVSFAVDPADGLTIVRIRKDNGEEVNIYRKRWERKVKIREADQWEEKIIASYQQVPLALSWAISMHKSQGQSFDKVHIDGSKIFAAGQLYVALSRCRSLKGLSLEVPLRARSFYADSRVLEFFESLNETV